MSSEMTMSGREMRARMTEATDFVEAGGRVVVTHYGREAFAIVGLDDLDILRGFHEDENGDTMSFEEVEEELQEVAAVEDALRAFARLLVQERRRAGKGQDAA